MQTFKNKIAYIAKDGKEYIGIERITWTSGKQKKTWALEVWSDDHSEYEIIEKRQYKSRNALMNKMRQIEVQ